MPHDDKTFISSLVLDIKDADPDAVVRNVQAGFPNAGYRRMQS